MLTTGLLGANRITSASDTAWAACAVSVALLLPTWAKPVVAIWAR